MNSMMNTLPFGDGVTMAFAPKDLSLSASSGAWANMRDINGYLAILLTCGAGAAGQDPVVTLEQADDAAGTNAVALPIERVYYKVGAPTLNAATDLFVQDTAVSPESPATSYSTALWAGGLNEMVLLILVRPQDLADGKIFVRGNVPDTGATSKIGVMQYMPIGRAQVGANAPSILG